MYIWIFADVASTSENASVWRLRSAET